MEQSAVNCVEKEMVVAKIFCCRQKIEFENHFILITDLDSLIISEFYPNDSNQAQSRTFYKRLNGKAFEVIDSNFYGASENYVKTTSVNFYPDSVVLVTAGRFFNQSRQYDEGKTIFYLDSIGNPYLRIIKNGLIPPPTTRFEFSQDPYKAILFPEWHFLGLPAPYYPVKETRFGDLPPPSGESYRTYSYQYNDQSQLQAFERSWHEGSGEIWSKECISLNYP